MATIIETANTMHYLQPKARTISMVERRSYRSHNTQSSPVKALYCCSFICHAEQFTNFVGLKEWVIWRALDVDCDATGDANAIECAQPSLSNVRTMSMVDLDDVHRGGWELLG
jgi:hypothetical protein